jgi:hypothetical protein
MKKLLTFGFGFAFAVSMLTGFGCALTNYELITDNDQGQSGPKGKGHGHNNGGGVVDTAGNSYVRQSSQAATTYPDGTDNLIWFVDQKKNGDRKLSTVNYFTTQGSAFKDDLYCSPDWGGCKVSTSNDPEIGDVDDYDYRANPNCLGYRSLSLLVSTTRYYGECGRAQTTDRATKMIALANDMTPVQMYGATWLRGNLSALNTSIVLNNRSGSIYSLPITSEIGVTVNFSTRQMILDMTNPNTKGMAQNAISWTTAHPGRGIAATITVKGNDLTYHVKPTNNASSWPQLHY